MIRCRTMTRADLDRALDWVAAEGWNPGRDDADAFWAADPEGFFVAEDAGHPVAAISVVNHSAAFAFLGLYICRPSHRGRGVGLALWTHALAHAGDRTVGLDGVPAQQANYEASGFCRTGETQRHIGRLPPAHPTGLRPVTSADRPALVALEAAASGWSKPAYMTAWFTDAPTRHTLVLERAGTIVGAVTFRACRAEIKVGPLIAPDVATATDLLGAVAARTSDDLSIDLPMADPALAGVLDGHGFAAVFATARMYRGPAGPGPTEQLFAPASLELG